MYIVALYESESSSRSLRRGKKVGINTLGNMNLTSN